MFDFRKISATLRASPIRFWALAFAMTQGLVWHDGGQNTASRFAALRAVSEFHTIQIDHYMDWTLDWSKGPGGAFYSNKAPGPLFLALPLTFVLDSIILPFQKDLRTMHEGSLRYPPPRRAYKSLISFLLQVIPFTVLVVFGIEILAQAGVGLAGQHFAAVAAFFGNTAVFLMNSFFGHGLAAVFLLGLWIAVAQGKYFWVGMCFGWALCSDYGASIVALPILVALAMDSKSHADFRWSKTIQLILLGGLLPGILWTWYHIHCFGSPFAIAPQFYNPIFLESEATNKSISGILSFLPNFKVIGYLLFGRTRGLFFTQPWSLVVIASGMIWFTQQKGALTEQKKILIKGLAFSILSFFGVLYVNSSFNGWHGGSSPGPRYLSIVMPMIALSSGVIFDHASRRVRGSLLLGLGFAVVLWLMVFEFEPLVPSGTSSWRFSFENEEWRTSVWPWIKGLCLVFVFGWAGIKSYKISREVPNRVS